MYKTSFNLTGQKGNNAFAWDERGKNPQLFVPARIRGEFSDVQVGGEVVFTDLDEHGNLQKCLGLKNFIETNWQGIPVVIVDNHNHAFYFWYEALERGLIKPGATLVHVDQHKDMREAPEAYIHTNLDTAFRYTNEVVNVGNYIRPAMDEGLIAEVQLVTGEVALEDLSFVDHGNKILNIDLDYFAPEIGIDFGKAKAFIAAHLEKASFVTIATSPFFIDQELAIETLIRLESFESA
jgi:hypothetical protein